MHRFTNHGWAQNDLFNESDDRVSILGKVKVVCWGGGVLHSTIGGLGSPNYSPTDGGASGGGGDWSTKAMLRGARAGVGWVAGRDGREGAAYWASWGMRGAMAYIMPTRVCTWWVRMRNASAGMTSCSVPALGGESSTTIAPRGLGRGRSIYLQEGEKLSSLPEGWVNGRNLLARMLVKVIHWWTLLRHRSSF
ncbi:hypothetical protein BHM03_00003447 [Ensete ventricosum]|nr:hypothetical protein BHM03_00003447 [Ensete ventricosum]